MPAFTQRRNGDWSEWKRRFAYLPALAGENENGDKIWIWWDWYEKRSMGGGAYEEFRSDRAAKSVIIEMSY